MIKRLSATNEQNPPLSVMPHIRRSSYFSIFCTLAVSQIAVGQASDNFADVEQYVSSLLTSYAGTPSCVSGNFDTSAMVSQFKTADGKHRKWSEKDARDPNVENHMMEWEFPGLEIVTSTRFSYYGPTTWLYSLRLSDPTELPGPIGFGQTVAEFAKHFSISEMWIRNNGIYFEGNLVTFGIDAENKIQSLMIACIDD
jgi:hypothetical protein